MDRKLRNRLISIFTLVAIVALTILAYTHRGQIMHLRRYGYPGIFLIEFIANASVMLPIPGSAVTAAMAPLLNPFVLAVTASTAASIGELFGYLVGLGANEIVERASWIERVKIWLKKYGGITIALLAAIPNPIFDTAGIAAGALNIPPWRFFMWCWLGKTLNRLALTLGASALLHRFFI